MRYSCKISLLLISIFILNVAVFAQQHHIIIDDSDYIPYSIEKGTAVYKVPKNIPSTPHYRPQIIAPRKVSAAADEPARYEDLDSILDWRERTPRTVIIKDGENMYSVNRKMDIPEVGDRHTLMDWPVKKIIYETRTVRKIYGQDQDGKYWKKIENSPKKWYLCASCFKGYSKLTKFEKRWICEKCWLNAYTKKNKQEKNYIMNSYP
ncbi:hypothetical protein KAJ27_25910 [bacterium]|nr:hypothetical protein [bacterium]